MSKSGSFGPHQGKYSIKEKSKYLGDPDTVQYRSMWEKLSFLWCEKNPKVKRWSSEEIVIPYICPTDRRPHRYFMDLLIEWDDKTVTLVEIKPKSQTKPPRKSKNRTRNLQEAATYMKNQAKWVAAQEYARKRGWKFEIWTEKELKAKGIMKW
jgi:hypothetical protein